jgi:hypothetical protein
MTSTFKIAPNPQVLKYRRPIENTSFRDIKIPLITPTYFVFQVPFHTLEISHSSKSSSATSIALTFQKLYPKNLAIPKFSSQYS